MTDGHIKEEKTTRLVRYRFSDEEKQIFGEELANAHALRNAAQHDLDTVKKQIGARVTEADGIIASCVEKIRSGFEMRREPCTVIKDFSVCSFVVTRDSTGEVLEERTLTSEETQMSLDEASHDALGDETEEAATAAAGSEEETGEATLIAGQAYDVTHKPNKRKKTIRGLTFEDTETKGEKTRHVFRDGNGLLQLIDPETVIDIGPSEEPAEI